MTSSVSTPEPFADLNPPYATIVVDPPWHYAKTNADKSGEGYMSRPKSLGLKDRRPSRPVWVCDRHGELEPGETECEKCEDDR